MRACVFLVTVVVLASSATADESAIPYDNPSACMDGALAQFGQYIGDWDIEDWNWDQASKEWKPGAGARWLFVCIGEGTAIQDFWMPAGSENVGTNLRVYNTSTASWDIAWTMKPMPGFAHIVAEQGESGDIVMHYRSQVPDPPRRITFRPVNGSNWDWIMDITSDGGASWRGVYRIHATRRSPEEVSTVRPCPR